ncbi:hypothetical protein K461DRAFT_268076 [Myriangium duriaei CBS 260.36]|uniref:Uncharacterized protein n=1 Tax=Myriangium duriaei CBS 260.36 TaxID=1168546 RepID=A0A9P4J5E4_9PEZI|nr:hypothetical protein K461DRAFT_268076 [Myriangium duriaei CBS 260.36]
MQPTSVSSTSSTRDKPAFNFHETHPSEVPPCIGSCTSPSNHTPYSKASEPTLPSLQPHLQSSTSLTREKPAPKVHKIPIPSAKPFIVSSTPTTREKPTSSSNKTCPPRVEPSAVRSVPSTHDQRILSPHETPIPTSEPSTTQEPASPTSSPLEPILTNMESCNMPSALPVSQHPTFVASEILLPSLEPRFVSSTPTTGNGRASSSAETSPPSVTPCIASPSSSARNESTISSKGSTTEASFRAYEGRLPSPRSVVIPEDVPLEIFLEITCLLEIKDIGRLRLASKPCNERYTSKRQLILAQALPNTYPDLVHDMIAVNETMGYNFAPNRTKAEVEEWLARYPQAQRVKVHDIDPKHIDAMIDFHCSHVLPAAHCYATWALRNMEKSAACELVPLPQRPSLKLSKTEKIRLCRAIYRFQLGCNVFDKWDTLHARPKWPKFSEFDIIGRFLYKFEPWEIEQVIAIHDYAFDLFDRMILTVECFLNLDDISDLLDSCGWRSSLLDFGSHERMLYTSRQWKEARDVFVDSLVSQGVEGFIRANAAATPYDMYQITLQHMRGSSAVNWLGWEVSACDAHRAFQKIEGVKTRDIRHQRLEALPFQGDDSVNGPPFGWCALFEERYVNIFGHVIDPREPLSMRAWGYVMWDRSRFEAEGALELMEKERVAMNVGGDLARDTAFWG